MEYFEALEINAMKSVINPDEEAKIRQILRWYSKTFHTPLHECYDLPFDEILTHYYEEIFTDMEDVERNAKLERLSMTEEEWELYLKNKQSEEDEFIKAAEEEAEKIENKHLDKLQPLEKKPLELQERKEEPLIKMDFSKDAILNDEELDRDMMG
ncbi:MAG: hypothetical protein KGI08_10675 [Thaumarchaeota archaeon]|nr:hypothetical protein [Nitrososphaerota archaeon]